MNQLIKNTTANGMPLNIQERLRSASSNDAKTELKALAVAFNNTLSAERAVTYFEAIGGEPLWAIKLAAREFRTGKAPEHSNRAFMPSPAELGRRIREIVRPHRENVTPHRVPRKEPEFIKEGTPDSRARLAADILRKHGFGDLADKRRGA